MKNSNETCDLYIAINSFVKNNFTISLHKSCVCMMINASFISKLATTIDIQKPIEAYL